MAVNHGRSKPLQDQRSFSRGLDTRLILMRAKRAANNDISGAEISKIGTDTPSGILADVTILVYCGAN